MKVFKLVCTSFIGDVSSFPYRSVIDNSDYVLRYGLNRTTKARVGKLYGFKSFDDALEYKEKTGYGEFIFEGEAENVSYPKFIGRYNSIDSFLKLKKMHKPLKNSCVRVPKGTITFDSFTPTKRMD